MNADNLGEHDKLFNIILSEELTWEGLIRDIVREEKMDPWNIDITKLTDKFLNKIKCVEKFDFRVSGKFLLAASILLKMKSDYLLNKIIPKKDNEFINLNFIFKDLSGVIGDYPKELIPRIPMLKKRPVALQELLAALQKAMLVQNRRIDRANEKVKGVRLRLKRVDLSSKIIELYDRITYFFKNIKKNEILFTELIQSNTRDDVIWTFVPLLYLSNRGKVALYQEDCFRDIYVRKP